MALSHIPHDVQMGDHNIIVQGAMLGGHCIVEDHVYISALCAVHPHVRIGSYAILGGVSGVVQDVPPYVMAQGERATAHGLNSVGLRRADFNAELRKAIKETYKAFFIEETSVSKGLVRIREKVLSKYKSGSEEFAKIQAFIGFIEKSDRGIISAKKKKGDS